MRSVTSKKVGLRDVASACGVSIATVSRILRGDESFMAATVERVRATARQMNYRPNATARNLQKGSTSLAGVMMPIEGFYGRIIRGISHRLLEDRHLVVIGDAAAETTEAEVVHQMVERMVDGIILRPTSEEIERSYYEEIWQRNIPLIVVDRELSLFKTDFVGSDDIGIGAAAARHLVELGHRKLIFFGHSVASTSRLRGQGFRDVTAELPGTSAKSISIDLQGWDAVLSLLQAPDRPTGVFCYNDGLSMNLITRLRALGLRAPEDISVIGCGQEFRHAGLTTCDQHEDEIGRQAAELYLERIKHPSDRFTPKIIRIPATLVQGSTTTPPPAAD